MNSDLITIVVPIYKVEKYLEECITSLLNQTYKNIEIILVDDGSPDNCGKMCDKYAMKDNRIKVIHKENGGLSDARNHGIDIAQGEYITFVDADDYIDLKYIETLYNAIKTDNTQISQCNILKVNDEKEILEKLGYLEAQTKSGKEILKEIYGEHWIENVIVCNKMFSIELLKNIRFPINKFHEDEFTTYKVLYNIDKIAIINEYLYNYRQNENSITGRQFNIKRLDALQAFEERLEFFREKNETELYQLTMLVYLQKIKEYYINTKKYIDNSEDIQQELIKKYKENYKILVRFKEVKAIKKLKWLIFYISPEIYYKMKA